MKLNKWTMLYRKFIFARVTMGKKKMIRVAVVGQRANKTNRYGKREREREHTQKCERWNPLGKHGSTINNNNNNNEIKHNSHASVNGILAWLPMY